MRDNRFGWLIGLAFFWEIAFSQGVVSAQDHQVLPRHKATSPQILAETEYTAAEQSSEGGIKSISDAPISTPSSPVSTTTLDCLIEPHMSVDVATATSGIVRDIDVDRGDMVENKQVLAHLKDDVEMADLAQAKARMALALRKFKRLKTLSKKEMIASEKLDEAKSEYELAKAEFQKASALLQQRTITSPFEGVIVERYVSQGELVDNNKIVRMAQINPLNVEIVAPVSMLGDFTKGTVIEVYPEGPSMGTFEARVLRVDRVVDAASGMFRVRLNLPNPDYKISAGVRCKAVFTLNAHGD